MLQYTEVVANNNSPSDSFSGVLSDYEELVHEWPGMTS